MNNTVRILQVLINCKNLIEITAKRGNFELEDYAGVAAIHKDLGELVEILDQERRALEERERENRRKQQAELAKAGLKPESKKASKLKQE